ncbi:MAG: FCD domain-containing protein [Chloroflexi bacterium]|nr:FCD domain-containing protein [Chloroflexota bacterium]
MSEFLRYLVANGNANAARLPPLTELSQGLGISVASLREQLEVARALGLVEVRPRTGIRRLAYTFRPAVMQSLAYAVAADLATFDDFADLRRHIEAAYWAPAVSALTPEDHEYLFSLVSRAWEKLRGVPVQIPHAEHRELHLSIYRRLGNPFVIGLLEAYWEMYEAVGLAVYTDFSYLEKVWEYHQRMVEMIAMGDIASGYAALDEHMKLLSQRPQVVSKQRFE